MDEVGVPKFEDLGIWSAISLYNSHITSVIHALFVGSMVKMHSVIPHLTVQIEHFLSK